MFKKVREEAQAEADAIRYDARQAKHFALGGVIEHYGAERRLQTEPEYTSRLGRLISGQRSK